MNISLIGAQIARFRKARALTQEDLGRAVGVSTQAVSRWECGGAPDVALLPAIADSLHVTIDALFGREAEGRRQDAPEQFCRYILSQPKGRQLSALCEAVYACIQFLMPTGLWHEPIGYPEQCFVGVEEGAAMVRSGVELEEGLAFGVGSEAFSFMTLFPEPEDGWAAYFADRDVSRALFAVLARDGCLELLELLYSDREHYLVPGAAAARLGRPKEEVAELFAALHRVHLLQRLETELESGMIYTYSINENFCYIPFMILTRCLLEEKTAFYLQWIDRKSPLLRGRRGNQKEEPKP